MDAILLRCTLSAIGTKRTSNCNPAMSAFGGKADIKRTSLGVRPWGRTALAAQAATATIPIVFAVAIDPIEVGLVASLNRPGGNMTGVTNMNVDIGSKRLELLHEVLSKATNFGVLIDPTSAALSEDFVRVLQSAAHTLGVQLHVQHASTEQ